jgi:hypothetical protein
MPHGPIIVWWSKLIIPDVDDSFSSLLSCSARDLVGWELLAIREEKRRAAAVTVSGIHM